MPGDDQQQQSISEVLKKIRSIEIKTRHLVEDFFVGSYHSVFKGQGMNFEEVREYQPGDEIRNIDWNVTARLGEPFVKQFTEERELSVLLLVDLSASGNYGSVEHSKREVAAELAATLALSATRNNDRVGLLLFTDRVELYLPPAKGKSHVLRIIREVLYSEPEGKGTDLGAALTYLNRVIRRKCIAFLVSDFETPDFAVPLALTARRHDLIACHITDPMEETLPRLGKVMFEDEETGEQIEVDTSNSEVRRKFEEMRAAKNEDLDRLFRRNRVDSIPIRTDSDYLPAIKAFFDRRQQRRLH